MFARSHFYNRYLGTRAGYPLFPCVFDYCITSVLVGFTFGVTEDVLVITMVDASLLTSRDSDRTTTLHAPLSTLPPRFFTIESYS